MSLRGVERSAALCALWRAKVVQLAVGCDTRAARLELPGVRFFEVDTRRVAEFRERWMPPAAVQLGVDLAKPEHLSPTLVGAGFDVHCPTAWICEGLLEYHDPCFGERLFAALPQGAEQQLVLTVLDINWLRFLEKEHAQKPVRMAWRPSRLPALAWHRALLKRQGWRLQQALSELRPAAPQAAAPEADSLFHLLVASRGEKEEMRAAGWALPEKGGRWDGFLGGREGQGRLGRLGQPGRSDAALLPAKRGRWRLKQGPGSEECRSGNPHFGRLYAPNGFEPWEPCPGSPGDV
ncbi:unnamed protein product [Effrenium voratum]|uniref:S-adenosyl-L-methionine-dependent methyltransferase n=1 Tax=Effrenium voratum TaxID=2562239 RepID=A0AA36MN93_9DINO|nr:unnamed protein product [Effrenium voratum]